MAKAKKKFVEETTNEPVEETTEVTPFTDEEIKTAETAIEPESVTEDVNEPVDEVETPVADSEEFEARVAATEPIEEKVEVAPVSPRHFEPKVPNQMNDPQIKRGRNGSDRISWEDANYQRQR